MGTFCDLRGQWCLVLLALDSAGLRRRDRPGPGAIGMSECEAMAAVLTGWGANASCRAGHHTSVVDIPDCHVRDCPRVGAHCVLAPGCISHPETRSKGEWRKALSDSASCGVKRPSQGGATCAFYGIPVAALRSCPVSLRICGACRSYAKGAEDNRKKAGRRATERIFYGARAQCETIDLSDPEERYALRRRQAQLGALSLMARSLPEADAKRILMDVWQMLWDNKNAPPPQGTRDSRVPCRRGQ